MNSDDFLNYYNLIDAYLRKAGSHGPEVTFSQKIKTSSNNVVKRYRDELFSLGELRNAIVHNPKIGNKVIAEPHEETVRRIKELYEKITNPKKVIPEFQFEILGAYEDDYINDILIKMRKKSFSQFPVFKKENVVLELVNTNTISRWLSSQLEGKGTIMVENIKVKDLIPEIEFRNNYKFISRDTSIYEAYDLFANQVSSEKRNLDVLFITNSGKKSEKILGLITIEDIATKV